MLSFSACLILTCYGASLKRREQDVGLAVNYLSKYGYAEQDPSAPAGLTSRGDLTPTVRKAICKFQRFMNLPVTCKLDRKTIRAMKRPRCGMPDIEPEPAALTCAGGRGGEGPRMASLYSLGGSRWKKKELTYKIISYTPDLSRSVVNDAIAMAFKVWSDVINIEFKRVPPYYKSDVTIRFAKGYHGDGTKNTFDGPGGTLAHAFYPEYGGNCHFDEAETWTVGELNDAGKDLYQVAVHELGHTLGLGHSDVPDAIMIPTYLYRPFFKLHPDDVAGIQRLYGTKNDILPNAPEEKKSPEWCREQVSFDAVVEMPNGTVFAFRKKQFWRLYQGGLELADGPWTIKDRWGVDGPIDAAFTNRGLVFLFQGRNVWVFHGNFTAPVQSLSPRDFGLYTRIDAAFSTQDEKTIYFFKRNRYYKYITGKGRAKGYPRYSKKWLGSSNHPDAILRVGSDLFVFKMNSYERISPSEPKTSTFERRRPRYRYRHSSSSIVSAARSRSASVASAILGSSTSSRKASEPLGRSSSVASAILGSKSSKASETVESSSASAASAKIDTSSVTSAILGRSASKASETLESSSSAASAKIDTPSSVIRLPRSAKSATIVEDWLGCPKKTWSDDMVDDKDYEIIDPNTLP
ncbi:collagenase 3-like [Branchiostoma floridae]|uniref:Collagenase 3-like n=2 Tax=Branchiostoma floridae TaxID=7739 RepID=A0A9J7HPM8_BRAFL|nr:collagenase 3-like [Branchiostoma floridae]